MVAIGTVEESGIDTAAPIIDDPFPGIQQTLDAILAELSLSGDGEYLFSPTAVATVMGLAAGATHQRMRCRYLIFSTSAAAVVTLTVGSMPRTYSVPAADTRVIPLPIVIERGSDVSLSVSAGTVTGNLIARPE